MSTQMLWNELLEQVNPQDTEESDFDSVRMRLENEMSESSIIDLSIQYGGGNLTEGRDIHINLIMCAIHNFMRKHRQNTLQGKCLVQLVEEGGIEEGGIEEGGIEEGGVERVLLECPICYEEIEHQRTAMIGCGHEFCRPCLEQHIEINKMKCPMCREEIQNITVRTTDDYIAICELAVRTNLPSVLYYDTAIYQDFEYNDYVV